MSVVEFSINPLSQTIAIGERDYMRDVRVFTEEVTATPDNYREFIELVPHMIEQTRTYREVAAFSYRDFLVGAAYYAVNKQKEGRLFFSGNLKLMPGVDKYCAEMSVLDEANASGYREGRGLVVVGTTDKKLIKEVTGCATDTLHSCGACRRKYEADQAINEDMPVISVGSDSDLMQVHTQAELRDLYETDGAMEAQTQWFDRSKWRERLKIYDQLMAAHVLHPTAALTPSRASLAAVVLKAAWF